jgi:hypothetical protein
MTSNSSPRDVLKQARSLAQGATNTDFLVVRKTSRGPEVGELGIGVTEENELNEIVAEELSGYIESLRTGKTEVRDLDVVNTVTTENILQYTDVDSLPDTDLVELLTTRSDFPQTTYDQDPEPNFQLIRLYDNSGNVLIGVQNFQNTTLVETSSTLTMLLEGDQYQIFDGEMIIIRDNLNAIYYKGHVFVMSPKSFESMFNLRDEYEEQAQSAISDWEESGIKFQDEDQIEEWLLSHINMLREMCEIQQSGLPSRTEPSDLIQLIEDFSLDVNYRKQNGEVFLDIDDYTDSWQLLRLLGAKYAETEQMDTRWEIDEGRRL